MPKGDAIPQRVIDAASQAAQNSQQRAELKLGFGRCGWLQTDPAAGVVSLWALRIAEAGSGRGSCAAAVRLTPARFSVRSRVHEYGGGAWVPGPEGAWFVNDRDQGIYLQPWNGEPPQLWWRATACRYGDLVLDEAHQRLLAVEEQHRDGEVTNRLVAISRICPQRLVLAEGADFYAAPAPSLNGQQLAWLEWDHPLQPWTATRLQLASVAGSNLDPVAGSLTTLVDGCKAASRTVNGESLLQPRFAADGALWVVSDRSGWWNLYRIDLPRGDSSLRGMLPLVAEFAAAPWQLGGQHYDLIDAEQLVAGFLDRGRARWGVLNWRQQRWQPLPGNWGELAAVQTDGEYGYALAGDDRQTGRLIRSPLVNPATSAQPQTLLAGFGDDATQPAQPFSCGAGRARVHGFYYRAANPNGCLLVHLHGGPTSYRAAVYDRQRAFWLEQGYSLVEPNYRGSSGYGRGYRLQLHHRWGEIDSDDATTVARHAIEQGWAQVGAVAVRGNSAGGYTLLRALQRQSHPFAAAGCHYGIGDLANLARHTHKFESRYLDWLIGDPQHQRHRYRQRSPLLSADSLTTPVIFFQGSDDRVVPAEQTYSMYCALQANGVASRFLLLEGEAHGFRRADSRAKVLQAEWAFYQRHLRQGAAVDDVAGSERVTAQREGRA
ncbi:alpha/beta hydrolase family protein [Motiliproteus sediminis]|uniref:alpha/beta hydrolase family protein n=1 Tax=Motiliproteus sediminis TaxID=1468178 RepID=UPI001AEF6BE4|nr:prolyl oligopeptidase family serine peptidase [Motiliproteus sediminis]